MIKNIVVISSIFFFIFFVSFSFHQFIIDKQQIPFPFSLKKVYIFHLGFSLLITINFLVFSNVPKVFNQLGFIYLATIVLKLLLFCIIFYKELFKGGELSFSTRLSLCIPMILFLTTEAIFVSKIIKKKQ